MLNMENAINLQLNKKDLLIALLLSVMILAAAFLNLQHKTIPIAIPQAIELQWSADTAWMREWK